MAFRVIGQVLTMPTLQQLVVFGLFITVVYLLWYHLPTTHCQRLFAKSHGCQPPAKLPQRDRLFGLDLLLADIGAARKRMILPEALSKFRKYGPTWSFIFMGRTSIATIDPENIKAMLSAQFNDFSVGPRIDLVGKLIGRGIFINDGKDWEHSRVCERTLVVMSDTTLC